MLVFKTDVRVIFFISNHLNCVFVIHIADRALQEMNVVSLCCIPQPQHIYSWFACSIGCLFFSDMRISVNLDFSPLSVSVCKHFLWAMCSERCHQHANSFCWKLISENLFWETKGNKKWLNFVWWWAHVARNLEHTGQKDCKKHGVHSCHLSVIKRSVLFTPRRFALRVIQRQKMWRFISVVFHTGECLLQNALVNYRCVSQLRSSAIEDKRTLATQQRQCLGMRSLYRKSFVHTCTKQNHRVGRIGSFWLWECWVYIHVSVNGTVFGECEASFPECAFTRVSDLDGWMRASFT